MYKDNNPKSEFGNAKPQLALIPSTALIEQAKVHENGANKYGPFNWRGEGNQVSAMVYASAILRHFYTWVEGEDIDSDSKCKILGHIIANCNILIDAEAHGNLIDDRPVNKKVNTDVEKDQREWTAPVPSINGIVELNGICPDTGLPMTQVLSPDLPDFIQSEYYPSKPEWLPHIYQRLMMCIFTKRSESKNLFLGLGAGAMLKALAIQDYTSKNITVDNDPKMIEYFGSHRDLVYMPHLNIIEADAMTYLFSESASFDHIFVDIYSKNGIPFGYCDHSSDRFGVKGFVEQLVIKTGIGTAINIPNVKEINMKYFETELKKYFPSVFVLSLEYVGSAIKGAIVLAHKYPNYYPNLIEHVEHFNATEAEVLAHMEQRVDYRIGVWQPK